MGMNMGTWGKFMAALVGSSVAVLLLVLLSISPIFKGKKADAVPVVEITAKAAGVKIDNKPVSVGEPPLVIASLPQELTPPAAHKRCSGRLKIVANDSVELPAAKSAPTPAPVAAPAKAKKTPVAKKVEKPKPKPSLVASIKRWFDGIFETQR